MYRYITTEQELEEVVNSILRPYCLENRNNLIALDAETYLTSMIGYIGEEASAEESIEESEEKAKEKKKAKPKKKKKKNKIPRPLKLKDGSYTGHMRTLSLGLDPNNINSLGGRQIVIDCMKIGYRAITRLLKDLLEGQLVIGHNLKYDWQFLYVHCGIKLRRMIDTNLIDKIRGNGLEKGYKLDDLYNRYLDYFWFLNTKGMSFKDYSIHKHEQQVQNWAVPELPEDAIQYAADDVFFILHVWERLKQVIADYSNTYERDIDPANGIRSVIRLESSMIPVVAMAELRGVKINRKHHEEVIKTLEENRDEAAERVNLFITNKVKKAKGRRKDRIVWLEDEKTRIKVSSSQQVKEALFYYLQPYAQSSRFTTKWNKLGNDLIAEGKDPKEDIDAKETLNECFLTFHMINSEREWDEEIQIDSKEATIKRFFYEHELTEQLPEEVKKTIDDLLVAKQAISLLSKFGQKILDVCTDRDFLHTNFNQLGTESGRMSSSGDMNLQQISGKGILRNTDIKLASLFRETFCAEFEDPEDEWVLVVADWAQLQARLAALYCNATELIKNFADPDFDIHGDVARAIMNLDYRPAKDSPERKDIGKTFGFSALFGAYPKKIKAWMRDKTDNRVNWTLEQATAARANFFSSYPDFETGREDYARKVETLPSEVSFNLYPFRWNQKENKTVPFHIARTMGKTFIRPRGFAIPNTYSRLTRYQMSKWYKPTDEDRDLYKLRFGNFYKACVDKAIGEGFNHEIQGAEANLMKIAAINIHYDLIKEGFKDDEGIIIFNHDEFVIHCRKKNAETAKRVLETEMVRAGELLGVDGVTIEAEAHIGHSWYTAKA